MKILIYIDREYIDVTNLTGALSVQHFDHEFFDSLTMGCYERKWEICLRNCRNWDFFIEDVNREKPSAVISSLRPDSELGHEIFKYQVDLATQIPFIIIRAGIIEPPFYQVTTDETIMVTKLTTHLIAEGYKKIHFVGPVHKSSELRCKILNDTLLRHNLPLAKWHLAPWSSDSNFEWMKQTDRPEAVLCFNDWVAMAVLERAKEIQIQIPEQLGVCGIDGIALKGPFKELTTMHISFKHLAEVSLDLVERLGGKVPVQGEKLILVPPVFHVGRSSRKNTLHLSQKDQEFLDSANKVLEEHFNKEDCQRRACSLTGVGISHFQRKYSKLNGKSFTNILLEKRLDWVAEMLLKTNKTPGELANLSGLNNMSYFFKNFKLRFSTTPQQYRQLKNI